MPLDILPPLSTLQSNWTTLHDVDKSRLIVAVRKTGMPKRALGRLEVARDNMGHAGSTGSITLDFYSKSWWEERVDAVTRVVEAVFTEPEKEKEETNTVVPPVPLRKGANGDSWVPFWVPKGAKPDENSMEVVEKNGRGERI